MENKSLSLTEASVKLKVSAETIRKWEREGKIKLERDERNRRRVPLSEVERAIPYLEFLRGGEL